MKWPRDIQIRIFSRDSRRSLENLAVFVTFVASRKNSYSFGPFLTNKNGEIELATDDIRKWIAETKNEFPMDYVDDIEQCDRVLVIEVESFSSLEMRWSRINEIYPDQALLMRETLDGKGNFLTTQTRKEILLSDIYGGQKMGRSQLLIQIEVSTEAHNE
jgi:hypothetical protein